MLIFSPYLLSFLIYAYLKRVLAKNESYRVVYNTFLKDKYT